MMSDKKIIIAAILFFLLSAVYLSFMETRQQDLNTGKNWWALAFSNPKSNDLSFTIENHSQKNNFHWEVISGSDKINEGDASISKGDIKNINLDNINTAGKISINVISGTDKKEIYKILP